MIITKAKPLKEIKAKLKKSDKIGIISCNTCTRICNTGGKKKMRELAMKLRNAGFEIVDTDLIGIACNANQIKRAELRGDTDVVLACDAGVYNLKKLYPKRKIIPALNTIGLAVWNEKGNIHLVRKFA